jgi:hypothetical protein
VWLLGVGRVFCRRYVWMAEFIVYTYRDASSPPPTYSQSFTHSTTHATTQPTRNTVAVALLDKAQPPVSEGEGAALLLRDESAAGGGDRGPTIPVGEALLGRVVDPLGRPLVGLDPPSAQRAAAPAAAGAAAAAAAGGGGGEPAAAAAVPLDAAGIEGAAPLLHRAPPGIMARKPLCSRLATGVKALDVFHPLAHGQCFAVLGRPGSGKTALALQVVVNQKGGRLAGGGGGGGGGEAPRRPPLRCVYVAVGQVGGEGGGFGDWVGGLHLFGFVLFHCRGVLRKDCAPCRGIPTNLSHHITSTTTTPNLQTHSPGPH